MRQGRLRLAALIASAVFLLVASTGAAAAQRENTHSFGLDGTAGATFPNEITSGAYDQTNDRLYAHQVLVGLIGWDVNAPGSYSPLTSPWPFSPGPGTAGATRGIAVDNRPGATDGRIYRIETATVIALNPDGTSAGVTFPDIPTPRALCGVAVDSEGNVFVANANATATSSGVGIRRFTSEGTELPPIDTSGYPGLPCRLAIDASDDLYVATNPVASGQVWKYTESSGYTSATLFDPLPANGVAVNRSTGHVFVAHPERVTEYDTTGNLIREFGNEFGSSTTKRHLGVAVDEATDEVYVTDSNTTAAQRRIKVFGAPATATPEAVTQPATNVARVEADLNAEVDPAGGADITECRFQWGTTTAYANSAPCQPEASGGTPITSPTAVTAELTGIAPGTTYHFRILATSADGTTVGANRTFATLPAVLGTETGDATAITETSATLHGSFNADGVETDYYFEYAAGTAACPCANKAPLPVPPGADGGDATESIDISQNVTGLIPSTSPAGQTYTYRLAAVNTFGTTFGASRTFSTLPAVKSLTTLPATEIVKTGAKLNGTLDPAGASTDYYFEYGNTTTYGSFVPVPPPGVSAGADPGVQDVSATVSGLETGVTYNYRLVAVNSHGTTIGPNVTVVPNEQPTLTGDVATDVNTDGATLNATINPNALATEYYFEYGDEDCSLDTCTATDPVAIGSGIDDVSVEYRIPGLSPGETYNFRVIATNSRGTVTGENRTFTTFPTLVGGDDCANLLVRKQTGAGMAPRCRAYELVSAADSNGYDIESNLIPGQEPLAGYPQANDAVLYTVRHGTIPGSGNPPNRGGDPYLARRTANGWTTAYVGLQADGTPTVGPFSSELLEAGAGLDNFAFGGPESCDPCFEDGSVNIPLRRGDGSLVKGMAGSEDPGPADPAGGVRRHFSADGTHFLFGSTSRFEPQGNSGSLSIYKRNLAGGTTQVVSTLPNGSTMPGGDIEALDISADGSRVLVGRVVGTDAAGNALHELYMHLGSPQSVLVADTASGVLFSGMNESGTRVFFTTSDQLAGDTDGSTDLFVAEVGSGGADVSRVSVGTGAGNTDACDPVASAAGNHWNEFGVSSAATCGVVAIAGGGGISAGNGTAYFLSPEQLDGSAGVADEPNLYRAEPGSSPEYVATVEPDNAMIAHAVSAAALRDSSDLQVTPDARFAAFSSDLPLTGSSNADRDQIYRAEAGGDLICASCAPTNAAPSSDTTLTSDGLNLTDDGRVLYTSKEQLVLRDTNRVKDVYEWDEGDIALVTTGLDSSDSGLLTASADGRDVYFFTRQTLAPQDANGGAMKVYDARELGGFLFNPPSQPCVAADECRGPGTATPPSPPINTYEGTAEPQPEIAAPPAKQRCRKGFVKERGKCVRRKSQRAKRKKANQRARRKKANQRARRLRSSRSGGQRRSHRAAMRSATREHRRGTDSLDG